MLDQHILTIKKIIRPTLATQQTTQKKKKNCRQNNNNNLNWTKKVNIIPGEKPDQISPD